VYHQQEEPDIVQGVPSEEVFDGGDVQEWFPVRTTIQLVQDTLSTAGTAATTTVR
jgi:hypothetical protein